MRAAMKDFDQAFPAVLAKLHRQEFDSDDVGIDFEPFDQFQSASENADWIKNWTGNQDLAEHSQQYRVFGMDSTGGLAAIWCVREKVGSILEQPIVFFGSEGEVGVVAYDFSDYLWLLASGVGPMEAVEYGAEYYEQETIPPNAVFASFANKHASAAKKTGPAVLTRAKEAFPTFCEDIAALCR